MAHRRLLPENKGLYNVNPLYYIPKPHSLNDGIAKNLPKAYKKYYEELMQKPTAVHHIPVKEKYQRDPETGVVKRLQDDPPALIYPKAFHRGLWGGAAVIKGFSHPHLKLPRIPRYWIPKLEISVVYSEVLDLFITTAMTKRTIQLINKHYGFDHYLLQTPACDLRSDLALKIKRKILLSLDKKELPHTDPEKRDQVYNTYKHYLQKYDSEYIQWYGLKIHEAVQKMNFEEEKAQGPIEPLKHLYRKELIQELVDEQNQKLEPQEAASSEGTLSSIFTRLNPFKKSS
ncbi:39S ribosomal protein L28, mitochondrial [Frankliniella fusca]|uniref:Large ribosomal subunit protein bL28m n=1 Tax=Frankliniella fusca TaxID=407009 RepID=A0AAE1HLG7_9NEOP|nr:39S ribosomal protein L28, mitochondrial [Frankliniella fusca]